MSVILDADEGNGRIREEERGTRREHDHHHHLV